jgi:phage terminase large subunit
MKYCVTTALEKIQSMQKRIRVVQGGTSASKTISILIDELNYSLTHPNKITSVVTGTFPNLRIGAMRDFLDICKETKVSAGAIWNKSDHIMYLPNDSVIEFYSIDTMGALGARRDRLFVNEANRLSWDTFSQLEIRTRDKITIDFNPATEFWVHEELLGRPDVDFTKLTYLDNEALDEASKQAIEARRGDGTSNWWRVYGLGEIGSLEGNVYSGWIPVDEIPDGFVLKRYGLDFGWNDPVAVVAVYEHEETKDILLDEKLYRSFLPTPNLVTELKKLPEGLFIGDSARPEIINELDSSGLRCIACNKTPGEKMNGKRYNIELVQRRKVFYTRSSKNLEQEYLTYAWRKQRSTGKILEEPEDGNDHLMDAIAYAIRDMARKPVEYGDPR